VKHILRYLQGTLGHELLHRTPTSKFVVYTDTGWVGCPNTRRSTSGYAVFLSGNLVSWSSTCQNVMRWSTASWPTTWRTHASFVSFFKSYTTPCHGQPSSTATMSAQSTSPPISSSISTQCMLRLIFTSSTSALLLEMFASSTSRRPLSLPAFS
jgi:hypothetical protein